jgi:hypothetical protein
MVAAEWAALEEHLISALAFGLFAMTNAQAHKVAKTALYALDSQSARLSVIEALLEQRVAPELHRFFVDTLKHEIRKRAKERNNVVHANWGIAREFPNDVILVSPENEHQRYSLKDFEDITDRIIATSNQVGTFTGWISGSIPCPFPVTLPLLR